MWVSVNFNDNSDFLRMKDDPEVSGVIIFANGEIEFEKFASNLTFEEVLDFVNSKEIPLYIVRNGFDTAGFDPADTKYRNVIGVDSWPTWFLTQTYSVYENYEETSSALTDMYSLNFNRDYNHLFISLTNRPYPHRCQFMDLLSYDTELFSKGAMSFPTPDWDLPPYNFENWNPTSLSLTERCTTSDGSKNLLIPPLEFDNSFMTVILETSVDKIFFTEKLASSLMFNKPFLALAAPEYHKKLQDLGFELYTEIFDYSFDDSSHLYSRINGIIENLKRYKNSTPEDLKIVYDSIKEKALRNKQKFIEIASDVTRFPQRIQDFCEEKNPELERNSGIDYLYWKYKV